jgi:hypothetical protein
MFPPPAAFFELQPVGPPGFPGQHAPSTAHWAKIAQ